MVYNRLYIMASISLTNSSVAAVAGRDMYYNQTLEDHFPLPRLIDTFRGREDKIIELDSLFFEQRKSKIVICGLPGFGKTELSKQYAQHCLNNGKIEKVFWIRSEHENELKESYKKLKPIYDNNKESAYLFIFDNCVSRQSIAEYEPPRNESYFTIFTSHEQNFGLGVISVKLTPLSSKPATEIVQLLCNEYKEDDFNLYKDLADSVDNIPLGLHIIAGYINQSTDCDLKQYLDNIKQSKYKIIGKKIPRHSANGYKLSIYSAMEVSLNKLKELEEEDEENDVRELALDLLFFSSYFNPDFIFVTDLMFVTKTTEQTSKILSDAFKLLINFSFLNIISDSSRYSQHRLTQSFVQKYLTQFSLQEKYFSICLSSSLGYQKDIERNNDIMKEQPFSNNEIFKNANLCVTTVYNFYKEICIKDDINLFLKMLISNECIECITTIFKNQEEKTNISQYNLLYYSCFCQKEKIFYFLLNSVNNDEKQIECKTLMPMIHNHFHFHINELELIKLLIACDNFNIRNYEGDIHLFYLIKNNMISKYYTYEQWDDMLLNIFKFDKYTVNDKQQTLLHLAVASCYIVLTTVLLEKYGMVLNQKDIEGRTPLDTLFKFIALSKNAHRYFRSEEKENYNYIFEELLKRGAVSNVVDKDEGRSLMVNI